jgi:hypothetical protein
MGLILPTGFYHDFRSREWRCRIGSMVRRNLFWPLMRYSRPGISCNPTER